MDRDSGILYHFSSMGAAEMYKKSSIGILRTSKDCGETWSKPEIIWPEHGIDHQIVVTVLKSTKGEFLVPTDQWGNEPFEGEGNQDAIHHAPFGKAFDQKAWTVLSPKEHTHTSTQSHHTSIVELRNGSILAIGREHDIDGTMPQAISKDGGYTFKARASSFTGIHSGEREVMIRLGDMSQPLMHCTFANGPPDYRPTYIPDSSGGSFPVTGVYCALSFDEGHSWDTRKLVTTNLTEEGKIVQGRDHSSFKMSHNSSEPDGYMAATVTDDGMIHLITSQNSYSFNLAWLKAKASPAPSAFQNVVV